MEVVTIRNAPTQPKEFAWSYTKLNNYETCPRRHEHVDVLKDVDEGESEHLIWGNQVHAAAAAWLEKGTPLPPGMEYLTEWLTRIKAGAEGGRLLTERQLAMTRDQKPCGWFDRKTWVRAKADALTLKGPVALSVDWKTGKIIEDSVQLQLVGALLFVHYPEIKKIRSSFIWLKENAETTVHMSRDDLPTIWSGLHPRVESLELAALKGEYPPKPGYLCKSWCPVSSCEYFGKSIR